MSVPQLLDLKGDYEWHMYRTVRAAKLRAIRGTASRGRDGRIRRRQKGGLLLPREELKALPEPDVTRLPVNGTAGTHPLPSPERDRVLAAARQIVASGQTLTYARLCEATGKTWDQVEYHVRRIRADGRWPWRIAYAYKGRAGRPANHDADLALELARGNPDLTPADLAAEYSRRVGRVVTGPNIHKVLLRVGARRREGRWVLPADRSQSA